VLAPVFNAQVLAPLSEEQAMQTLLVASVGVYRAYPSSQAVTVMVAGVLVVSTVQVLAFVSWKSQVTHPVLAELRTPAEQVATLPTSERVAALESCWVG